ncbi:hypothetical protein SAMN05444004_101212 [Jannaschia faecimaris]|uniref:Uncharacterized protein n=1 Tax=Jannaschia faecimaris TaxID=1244108 RepID=A0A1H3J5W2_9RHOB|nr:hypothetical protein [Jannaschia faecimaris]SDY35187.1 hypothetical protein SAMN05444004_101212 [Jannaschia faecimaris]
MTQEEFDALDNNQPSAVQAASSTGSKYQPLSAIKAQGPVRLAAVGLSVVATGIFGGVTFLGADPVQVSAILQGPAQLKSGPGALPKLPQEPPAVAQLPPTRISGVQALQQTQAVADPTPPPTPVAPAELTISDAEIEAQAPVVSVDCDVAATATARAGAIIALKILAPCDAGSRVDIFQGDLQTAFTLDSDGGIDLELPALSAAATVAVVVEDHPPVSLLTEVRDMGDYNRAVLYWQGNLGLEMHAFEDAAAIYGSEAHVSQLKPRDAARALTGNGGYMTILGDADLAQANVALVYTAPAAQAATVSIEAPILAENCGQKVVAGTIFIPADDTTRTQDLMLTLPTCEAEGDYVMLGNLMAFTPSINLASN